MLSRAMHLGLLKKATEQNTEFDVIVIGGGATGLGTALDAATRGLKVLLLEANDFAKGTSSRATKLAHGGVRYLAQGNISLVREALHERGRMLANAPGLVKPLAFVIPARNWFGKLFYWLGLKVYDLLAGRLGVGPTTLMSRNAVLNAIPTLKADGLAGGVRYFDAQFDDARLAIALMKTIHRQGGLAVNYVRVTGFEKKEGRICGVSAQDTLGGDTYHLKAKAVVNATGVWVDEVRNMDDPSHAKILSPSQGVHVVIDSHFYPSKDALLVPKTADGRVLFVVPWLGKTLIGTTDTARQDSPLEPKPLDGEIDFVLNTAGQYLKKAPTRADVRSVFVGLRPLVKQGHASSTKSISREHTILTDPSGLVTITGGKWTTYRSMAEEVMDVVVKQHSLRAGPSKTVDLKLDESSAPAVARLLDPRLDFSRSDMEFAVSDEMAVTIEDILARRSRALFLDAEAALTCMDEAADVLRMMHGVSDVELQRQRDSFKDLVKQYRV